MPLIGATYRQNLLDTLISRGLIERSPHYVLSMSDYIYNMFDIMPHELPSKVGFPYVTIMVYNPTLTGGKVPTFSEAAPFTDYSNLLMYAIQKGEHIDKVDLSHLVDLFTDRKRKLM